MLTCYHHVQPVRQCYIYYTALTPLITSAHYTCQDINYISNNIIVRPILNYTHDRLYLFNACNILYIWLVSNEILLLNVWPLILRILQYIKCTLGVAT